VLTPYDNILILRQPDWELPRSVAITGQVKFPGQYVLKTKSDRLLDLVNRAGGLTKDAYARGAELFREGVRPRGSGLRVVNGLQAKSPTDSVPADSARADSVLFARGLAKRVGLDLPKALEHPDGRNNLILQAGDSVFVPEFDPTVRVLGAVNAPSTVVHQPSWGFDDYVSAAGGYSRKSDRGRAYVVQPGGSLQSVHRRFLFPDSKPKPEPGAIVYVPERDPTDRHDWAGLLGAIAQILASSLTIIVVATKL
jgi:protein involved in polysaccharide export with SLBB domain